MRLGLHTVVEPVDGFVLGTSDKPFPLTPGDIVDVTGIDCQGYNTRIVFALTPGPSDSSGRRRLGYADFHNTLRNTLPESLSAFRWRSRHA
jgi:hypothetical protein